MIKQFSFLAISLVFLSLQQLSAQSIFDKWPSLKTFHGVMSQTFHPSEEGNLKPIKERSSEMATKAADLAKSTVPAEFKTDKIINAVARLEKDSKALDEMVKNPKSTDTQIKESLARLHDVFHEIVSLCKHENH
jgi:hypothetical protein